MATKKELKADIFALDPNATIDEDASHDDLTSQLRKVKDTIEELEELAESIEELEEPAAKAYHVPKGKAMNTNAGIKSDGDEVTAKMVTGGAEKLELLKSKGLLV